MLNILNLFIGIRATRRSNYFRNITQTAVTLVKKSELLPKIYTIITNPNDPAASPKLYLDYHGQHIKLVFLDLNAAAEFINYLQASTYTEVKGFQVKVGTLSAGTGTYSNYTNISAGGLRPVQGY